MIDVDFNKYFSSQIGEQIPLDAEAKLFCFPYAGAGVSSYHAFCKNLPADVIPYVVRLPGREGTRKEAALTNIHEIIVHLARAIKPALGQSPVFFWGHSMGALVAFEVARLLRKEFKITGLIISGHAAPQLPVALKPTPVVEMSDAQFINLLQSYGGMPQVIFDNPDLLQLMLPQLRADLIALESYRYVSGAPLENDIFCVNGKSDHMVSLDKVMAWKKQTTGEFSSRWLPGSHFFINEDRLALVKTIRDVITNKLVQLDVI
ncbi:thioesterase [Shewanella sp. VB17]|uniref:thioesterase II family protein n=1 Tax=Shewanella sp. VB17 TaxID=2739432 RepID=UPI00156314C0|nr:alpha/beta fold hydrolase [Shewanella sp. VB17]NRD72183.1 thioesterase [Shewanella sp. VB17]